jgi:hypothetical protein
LVCVQGRVAGPGGAVGTTRADTVIANCCSSGACSWGWGGGGGACCVVTVSRVRKDRRGSEGGLNGHALSRKAKAWAAEVTQVPRASSSLSGPCPCPANGKPARLMCWSRRGCVGVRQRFWSRRGCGRALNTRSDRGAGGGLRRPLCSSLCFCRQTATRQICPFTGKAWQGRGVGH